MLKEKTRSTIRNTHPTSIKIKMLATITVSFVRRAASNPPTMTTAVALTVRKIWNHMFRAARVVSVQARRGALSFN